MTFDTRANYAIATAENGNYEHAKAVVIDLISEDYNNAAAHRAWGRVLYKEGKATDAVAAFRVAVALDSREPQLLFEFAEALMYQAHRYAFVPLSNMVEARDAVDAGLRLSPGDPKGLQLQSQLVEHFQLVRS